jgi:hypothetical protein
MSIYQHDGAAKLECRICKTIITVTWAAGDPPIYTPKHCNEEMIQTTHNDGLTPWSESCPCPSTHCCGERR